MDIATCFKAVSGVAGQYWWLFNRCRAVNRPMQIAMMGFLRWTQHQLEDFDGYNIHNVKNIHKFKNKNKKFLNFGFAESEDVKRGNTSRSSPLYVLRMGVACFIIVTNSEMQMSSPSTESDLKIFNFVIFKILSISTWNRTAFLCVGGCPPPPLLCTFLSMGVELA